MAPYIQQLQSYVQQILNSDFLKPQKYVFEGMYFMIENSMHPGLDDDEMPEEIMHVFIESMLAKLQRLGQQLPESKSTLLDCVLQIKNLTELYLYNLEPYYNEFICLAQPLLEAWNSDEELFLSGVGLLESFINNPDVLLDKEQYEQIIRLLQSYVFPFMATVTP